MHPAFDDDDQSKSATESIVVGIRGYGGDGDGNRSSRSEGGIIRRAVMGTDSR